MQAFAQQWRSQGSGRHACSGSFRRASQNQGYLSGVHLNIPKLQVPFWGPSKDSNICGSILGCPYIGNLPCEFCRAFIATLLGFCRDSAGITLMMEDQMTKQMGSLMDTGLYKGLAIMITYWLLFRK